jgi:type IV pilus assembly protein PilE
MGSVQKSKRTGAKVAIMEVAQAQERYFSVNMQYAYNLTTLQASSGAGLGDADDYTLTVAGEKSDSTTCASGEVCVTYTVTAEPKTISPQNNDNSCKKFTLTHTGIQAAEDSSAVDTSDLCW